MYMWAFHADGRILASTTVHDFTDVGKKLEEWSTGETRIAEPVYEVCISNQTLYPLEGENRP